LTVYKIYRNDQLSPSQKSTARFLYNLFVLNSFNSK